MTQTAGTSATFVIQREISRFMQVAIDRSESDANHQRRRMQRRYHRSWPLVVCVPGSAETGDMSVALYNASPLGIAFLSPIAVADCSTVLVKLFWHDEGGPRVPAVVRHVTPTEHGYLVGCEFAQADETLCEMALAHSALSHG
ncbi:MAG: PilZ domain-containing protein [Phycisphaerales bacterium]|nr:MAG: PilZ domain-containing protein [Phycisphaerales bacterium]